MESIIVEIRPGEGGADARDLIHVQFGIYGKACNLMNFSIEEITINENIVVFKVSGKGVIRFFESEAGGLRWQRVPPTEKRGRVHTSTITVAVLPEAKQQEIHIDPKDLKESFTCGSGPGGQHRNKNATAVQLTHLPSGVTVRAESSKSQKTNRENALAILKAKLLSEKKKIYSKKREQIRQEQVGSGMRGDKIRTIQVKHNIVSCHITGKKISYKDYYRGKITGLK